MFPGQEGLGADCKKVRSTQEPFRQQQLANVEVKQDLQRHTQQHTKHGCFFQCEFEPDT
jgi:hypothetical protein